MTPVPTAGAGPLAEALARAATDPAGLTDAEAVALLGASGPELDRLTALADARRATTVGDRLGFVVNRNLHTATALADPDRTRALVAEAHALGATEICVQGPLPAGVGGAELEALVVLVTTAAPVHLHAFRPAEIADAAARDGIAVGDLLGRLRAAGLGSVPGTGALVLDDGVRAALTGPGDPAAPTSAAPTSAAPTSAAAWLATVEAAHRHGLPSTATLVHGHVETPAHVVAHLRALTVLQERTGGFTEFIAMPYTPGLHGPARLARPRDEREVRAVHAVARLLLTGRIDHVQAAWPKLGLPLAEVALRSGADDVGGLLVDGLLDPAAGAEAGRRLSRADVAALADRLGRPPRERSTTYGRHRPA
ncbi:FO synthase [Kineococcus gynurae]|uniref:FO synthase n=1 Tax=Kineococcus gynurae TaxID=452979 RepID=A0ABV5LWL2_9ACTN